MLCNKEMPPLQNDIEKIGLLNPYIRSGNLRSNFFWLQFSHKAKDLRISALASKMGQAIKSCTYGGFKKHYLLT